MNPPDMFIPAPTPKPAHSCKLPARRPGFWLNLLVIGDRFWCGKVREGLGVENKRQRIQLEPAVRLDRQNE